MQPDTLNQCIDCVTKHIAQAMIIHQEEVFLGYPKHIKRVIGHLGEATRECLFELPELAAAMRQMRLKIMEDPHAIPPYMDILDYIDLVSECNNQKVPIPELPATLT